MRIRSSDNTIRAYQFGAQIQAGIPVDISVAGDYTGDGRADPAIYRQATGVWYIYDKDANVFSAVQWGGNSTDSPVSAISTAIAGWIKSSAERPTNLWQARLNSLSAYPAAARLVSDGEPARCK